MTEKKAEGQVSSNSLRSAAKRMGLDASLLYEVIIDLANEGLLSARCVYAAAGILLTELGLPEYYFRHISGESLQRILHAIATNMQEKKGRFVLSSRTAYLECEMDGDIQILMATPETRDHMEEIVGNAMSYRRWEYYYSEEYLHYTYIIRPDHCPELENLKNGQSRFAFAGDYRQSLYVPEETRQRYESFLARSIASVGRRIEFSDSANEHETRIMLHKNIFRNSLPLIRKILADRGMIVKRAYGEIYRTDKGRIASVCSFYVRGCIDPETRKRVEADLLSFLALGRNDFADLYLADQLSFDEMLFLVCAGFFVHHFIYRNSETDRLIMANLPRKEWQDAMAKRIAEANHSEYSQRVIRDALHDNVDLVKHLFRIFDAKFNPGLDHRPATAEIEREINDFSSHLASRFIDDASALGIFRFAARSVTDVLKTNFYRPDKRSFAFRLTSEVLDPLVFDGRVYGIFFVVGHYSVGTHMRAEDIARGGLRLLRVTPLNYENELDDASLLNFALGPRAQRLKHKDIAESGSKGVIVPVPIHADDGLNAVQDYSEGIMDLIFPSADVVDYCGRTEMIFWGPDEGTALLMDAVAARGKERGYKYWRTLTTGKEIGLPHDAYGLTGDDHVFALVGHENDRTELQMDGETVLATADTSEILAALKDDIQLSGMTTAGVMTAFRSLISRSGRREEDLCLMMTGGPDGDLGANQIQCYRGPICLIIDGGSVLFDPDGLDKETLRLLALNRHSNPRLNSTAYPREKLGPRGFIVERSDRSITLPDGRVVEDGAYFHKTFLTNPDNRKLVESASIEAFIPCGGFKDTINFSNVRDFLSIFAELRFIVEGANVFFDDTARDVIASETGVLQIRDSTANKGGVTSSSIAEVLTAFLLGEDYETYLVNDRKSKFRLAREVLELIVHNARAETEMLLDLHEQGQSTALYRLSAETSEQLLAFQELLSDRMEAILSDPDLTEAVLRAYIPPMLVDILGMPAIGDILGSDDMVAYRNAILTKKLASVAIYNHALDWDKFLADFSADSRSVLARLKKEVHPIPGG